MSQETKAQIWEWSDPWTVGSQLTKLRKTMTGRANQ